MGKTFWASALLFAALSSVSAQPIAMAVPWGAATTMSVNACMGLVRDGLPLTEPCVFIMERPRAAEARMAAERHARAIGERVPMPDWPNKPEVKVSERMRAGFR